MKKNKFKIILITGTTSGLGKALFELYFSIGMTVIAVNRRDFVKKNVDPKIHYYTCDITDRDQVESLVASLVDKKLIPDLWVLNAGINEIDNQRSLVVGTFKEVLDINLYGNLNFIDVIQKFKMVQKTILTISSTSTIVPNSMNLGYFISKLSLNRIFELLRLSDLANNYKVVILGPTLTNLNKNLPQPSGLQGKIFKVLALTSEEAALKIAKFSNNNKPFLHPKWTAQVFYVLLSNFLKLVPRFYFKPYSPL